MNQPPEYSVQVKNAYKVYDPDFVVLNGFNMKVPNACMYVYNIMLQNYIVKFNMIILFFKLLRIIL